MQVDLLAAVGISSSVRHTHQTCRIDLSPTNVLVYKIPAIDARPSCAITSGDITTLYHELVNDPMERRMLVCQRLR